MSAKIEQSLLNLAAAKSLFEESLSCSPDSAFQLSIKIEIAKTLRKDGNEEAAQKMLEEMLEQYLQEDSMIKADAMIQLGLCYFASKHYEKAYAYYKEADDYLLTTDNIELKLYNWLGISTVVAFMDTNRVQEGLDILLQVKHEAQQFGYRNFYIDSLNGIAKKHLMLGNYDDAIEYASQAMELGEKQGNKTLVFLMWGYLLEGYTGLYKKAGSPDIKAQIFDHACEMIDKIKRYKDQAVVKEKLILQLVNEALDDWEEGVKKAL